MNRICDIIKSERLNRNLTQKELAAALGVTQDSISLWEIGKRIPDTNYIIELSKIFGISAGYLLGLEDDFGARTDIQTNDTYTIEEQKFVEDIRKLSPGLRDILRSTLDAMLGDTEEEKYGKSRK